MENGKKGKWDCDFVEEVVGDQSTVINSILTPLFSGLSLCGDFWLFLLVFELFVEFTG